MDRVAYTPTFAPDGRLVAPPEVTIFELYAKISGGSHLRLEATSWAELWANYYDGQRRGLYIGVIGTSERKGQDPKDVSLYRKELARIEVRSCVLLEDYLKMRVYVRRLPAERVEEIDPTWYKGHPGATEFLRRQIADKRAECARRGITPNPDPRPWWEKGEPWNISTP